RIVARAARIADAGGPRAATLRAGAHQIAAGLDDRVGEAVLAQDRHRTIDAVALGDPAEPDLHPLLFEKDRLRLRVDGDLPVIDERAHLGDLGFGRDL